MNICLDMSLASKYTSHSQMARVVTEQWVEKNMFCPRCGAGHIIHLKANRPVADFACPQCGAIFESKAKRGTLGRKITDGAYETMIRRIHEADNPDFFFMSYDLDNARVCDFLIIPKHFFVDSIIEKRKHLADTARRAGWVGCNILLEEIPSYGRISLIQDGRIADKEDICRKYQRTSFLADMNITSRGWLMDVFRCLEDIKTETFTLQEMYQFEDRLQILHPENHNIRAKIRQQLQYLRDKGLIQFIERGVYRKRCGGT